MTGAAVSGGPARRDPDRVRSATVGRVALSVAIAALSAVVLAFLLLPIVALATYQPVHDLIHGFTTKVATDAIVVSLKTNAIAFGLMVGLGTPFAYAVGRSRFRGRSVVITVVELPLVMP
ncbi:MAG: molybdate ABC transporter permease subunit, partial [Actinomycetota bacterium]|nr:molybdate ABC transporter permease subunit [Actinomycetota bacterium]